MTENFTSECLLHFAAGFVNMSDSGSHSPDPDTNFETTFISSLAVYTKGSGKKAKESKSIKVKEFDFLSPRITIWSFYVNSWRANRKTSIR